ncbi:MAG TPA: YCF48-related protein [Candidatus Sulfotelmatobacter sp.]|jgi:hypothetical protein|nr:YCF48-related protein [Candidatus Sulfotelmatobacter sp.]
MPSDDRDPKFERALAQHLRGGSAQANCPDAETLAAYHERNLSLEEMAQWKQHISACEACQEALALVEATENQLAEVWEQPGVPVLDEALVLKTQAHSIPKVNAKAEESSAMPTASSPVAILRRRPALLRWAIPLGAVAAGVMVFIGIYEQRAAKSSRSSYVESAQNQAPPAPGPIVDQLTSKLGQQPVPKDEGQLSAEMSRQKKEQEIPAAWPAKPMAKAKELGDEVRESRDQLVGGRLEKKIPAPSAAASNLPVQPSTDDAVSENAPAIAAAPPAATPPAPLALSGRAGGVAAQRAPVRSDAKSVPSSAAETVTVEPAAPATDTTTSRMMMKHGSANQVVEVSGAYAGLILTPDKKVFWKLQPTGTLQLTTDGGKTFTPLDTGANANLTAGFAPSSRVCWLAGKAGTLLLTTDRGGHWARISTPITGDLGGVQAADAKHASIWDAANQISYETSDGGATWKQRSNK